MTVTNRVHLGLLYQWQKVVKLEHQSPAFRDASGMRCKRRLQVRFVCQRVNVHNQIGRLPGRAWHHSRIDKSVQP
jgi:hypothetical protein